MVRGAFVEVTGRTRVFRQQNRTHGEVRLVKKMEADEMLNEVASYQCRYSSEALEQLTGET